MISIKRAPSVHYIVLPQISNSFIDKVTGRGLKINRNSTFPARLKLLVTRKRHNIHLIHKSQS